MNHGSRMFQNRMWELTAWVVHPGNKNERAAAGVVIVAAGAAADVADVDSAVAAENAPVEREEKYWAAASCPVYAVFAVN